MNIQEYCFLNKISQGDLAKICGVCDAYISKIKHNQIRPNKEIKAKLESLGITVSTIDTSVFNSSKNAIIERLLNENTKLKEENKELKKENEKLIAILDDKIDKLANNIKDKIRGW